MLHVLHPSCSSEPRFFFRGSVTLPLDSGYAALLRHTLPRQACPRHVACVQPGSSDGKSASHASYGFGRVDARVHGEACGLPYGELSHCETTRYESTFLKMANPVSSARIRLLGFYKTFATV
jgi:hypothetical protein